MEVFLQDNYGIKWPTRMKITQLEDEMYRSNMFSEEELMAWEEKPRGLQDAGPPANLLQGQMDRDNTIPRQ